MKPVSFVSRSLSPTALSSAPQLVSKAPTGDRPTIADIARYCGLSKATVSRVLGAGRSADGVRALVRPETQARVQEAARALGYLPDLRARALAAGSTHTIGLLYTGDAPILDSVYEPMIRALTRHLSQAGYHLVFIPVGANAAPDHHNNTHPSWSRIVDGYGLDGCIAMHAMSDALRDYLREVRKPIVLLNVTDEELRPVALPDDDNGARLLTDHLADLGHRHTWMWINTECIDHFSKTTRAKSFVNQAEKHGMRTRVEHVTRDAFLSMFFDALSGKPADRPTAIMGYSHSEGIELLHFLVKRGVKVPDDVSVCCFNDVYPTAYTSPALTTVDVPADALGRLGATLMLDALDRDNKGLEVDDTAAQAKHILDEHVIVRASTAPPRSGATRVEDDT
ncbi:MAG: LacI family DNA-binding transcriptional regulator [Planctomycetota bacterium]